MKLYTIVVALTLSLFFCKDAIGWDETNYLHAGVGYGIGLGSTLLADAICEPQTFLYYMIPIGTVLCAATIKECTDQSFDYTDFNSTVFGGLLGILTIRFYF